MIERKIDKRLDVFFEENENKALLITGARQVGKTFSIRNFARRNFDSLIEVNFIENKEAKALFENASDSAEILLRLSAIAEEAMIPGKTLIFFDEVQECKELVTAIKFLVEDGRYNYILSGSLLGVELDDLRSVPVGYMDILEMYPLDFEEFAWANKVNKEVLKSIRFCFEEKKAVDKFIHEKMMELFRLYLIVGGMPEVVSAFLQTNDLKRVADVQRGILRLYKKDIAKYDPKEKLYLDDIFESIPGELNNKNKRFFLKNLNENFKFSRYENSFLWLKDAGVALPTFCADEPKVPLRLAKMKNLFKLFMSDVGLLAAMYMDNIQIKILSREKDINFGAVYENAVAQELHSHGYELYYFNSKKQGKLDFIIEDKGEIVPIEIKSGKDYAAHSALNRVIANEQYQINRAFVFCNENVHVKGKVVYCPIYMIMFLKRENETEKMIYTPDFSILQ